MRRRALAAATTALGALAFALPAHAALPVPAATVTADTTVTSADPSAPGGGAHALLASDHDTTYLRFHVTGLPIPPQRTVLLLKVVDPSADPTRVSATVAGWDEATVSQQTAPAAVTGTLASLPSVADGEWVQYDITPLVLFSGDISVRIVGGADAAGFASRETATPPQLQITTRTPAQELAYRLSRPKDATAVRYQATDSAGGTLDALKIVQDPAGGYLGVWHAVQEGAFVTRVGTSDDLLHWQRRAELGTHDSQPALALLPGGGALVVSEADEPGGPHLRFRRYASVADLLAAKADATFDAPRTLAPTAEGTPSIHSVDAGAQHITVGFHYFRDTDVDREATGRLVGFSDWVATPENALNSVFEALGLGGNIGDRDELTFRGARFTLQEGQIARGDFSSWREFLYDQSAGSAAQLPIVTAGASQSFGNGTATVLIAPSGRLALAVTYFIFGEGAAPGEPGELIYVDEFDDAPPPGTPADPGVPPDLSPLPVTTTAPPVVTTTPETVTTPPTQTQPSPPPVTTVATQPAAAPAPVLTPADLAVLERGAITTALGALRAPAPRRGALLRRGARYRLRLALPLGAARLALWTGRPGARGVTRLAARTLLVTTKGVTATSLSPTAAGRRALRRLKPGAALRLRVSATGLTGVTAARDLRVTLAR